jgi:hypothetical protein
MSKDTATVIGVVRAAQKILAERLDPQTPGDDRDTIACLRTLLGDDRFNKAVGHLETRESIKKVV